MKYKGIIYSSIKDLTKETGISSYLYKKYLTSKK